MPKLDKEKADRIRKLIGELKPQCERAAYLCEQKAKYYKQLAKTLTQQSLADHHGVTKATIQAIVEQRIYIDE